MAKGLFRFRINRGRSFFKGQDVLKPIERCMIRGLYDFGGFVRKTAMQSMRKAGKNPRGDAYTSKPGEPPRKHEGSLARTMRFAVDRGARAVIIGPQQKSSRVDGTPRRLEEGGSYRARLAVRDEGGRWHLAADAPPVTRPEFRTLRGGQPVSARVKPRPYMKPAFEIGNQNLRRFFGER